MRVVIEPKQIQKALGHVLAPIEEGAEQTIQALDGAAGPRPLGENRRHQMLQRGEPFAQVLTGPGQTLGNGLLQLVALVGTPEGKRPILQRLPEPTNHVRGFLAPSLLQGLEGLLKMGQHGGQCPGLMLQQADQGGGLRALGPALELAGEFLQVSLEAFGVTHLTGLPIELGRPRPQLEVLLLPLVIALDGLVSGHTFQWFASRLAVCVRKIRASRLYCSARAAYAPRSYCAPTLAAAWSG